jgi:molybdopterin-guanine dinucleotide biosynthesis protein A
MLDRFVSVSGFVLAGGASRRMGRDKAKLVLGEETMLERQIRLLRRVCRSVTVIGPPENFARVDVPVFPDELLGRGPLAGIYTGLSLSRTELNLFLGCDMPFMGARFLRFLCERACTSRADVTLPETRQQGLQPLSAVYRRRALGPIRARLAAGENEVSRFLPRVQCLVLPWREIARAGFPPRIFDNMNTREDYEAARRSFQFSAISGHRVVERQETVYDRGPA